MFLHEFCTVVIAFLIFISMICQSCQYRAYRYKKESSFLLYTTIIEHKV